MSSKTAFLLYLCLMSPPNVKAGPKSDAYTFTIFDPNFDLNLVRVAGLIFVGFQFETCVTTGRVHVQGFVILRERHNKEFVAFVLNQPWAANGKYTDGISRTYLPMQGLCIHNLQYCSSLCYCRICHSGTHVGPHINSMFCGLTGCRHAERKHRVPKTSFQWIGSFDLLLDRDRQRESSAYGRTLEVVTQMICEGCTDRQVMEAFPTWAALHYRVLAKLRQEFGPRIEAERLPPIIFWLYGATGTHKSRIAHAVAPQQLYRKDCSNDWFCGYTGQPIILFEELRKFSFGGRFSMLLELTDRYPQARGVKGGHIHLAHHMIIITSSLSPEEMWGTIGRGDAEHPNEDFAQLPRRLAEVVNLGTLNQAEKKALVQRMRQALWDRMQPATAAPEPDPEYGIWDPSEGSPDQVDIFRARMLKDIANRAGMQKHMSAIESLQPQRRVVSTAESVLAKASAASTPTLPPSGAQSAPVEPCKVASHQDSPKETCLACRRFQAHLTARADATAATEVPKSAPPMGVYVVGGSSSSSGSTAPSTAVSRARTAIDEEDERILQEWLRKAESDLNAADLKKKAEAAVRIDAKKKKKAEVVVPTPKPKGRPRADGQPAGSAAPKAPRAESKPPKKAARTQAATVAAPVEPVISEPATLAAPVEPVVPTPQVSEPEGTAPVPAPVPAVNPLPPPDHPPPMDGPALCLLPTTEANDETMADTFPKDTGMEDEHPHFPMYLAYTMGTEFAPAGFDGFDPFSADQEAQVDTELENLRDMLD